MLEDGRYAAWAMWEELKELSFLIPERSAKAIDALRRECYSRESFAARSRAQLAAKAALDPAQAAPVEAPRDDDPAIAAARLRRAARESKVVRESVSANFTAEFAGALLPIEYNPYAVVRELAPPKPPRIRDEPRAADWTGLPLTDELRG